MYIFLVSLETVLYVGAGTSAIQNIDACVTKQFNAKIQRNLCNPMLFGKRKLCQLSEDVK